MLLLGKILSERSPIVASMHEKPQILGLYMCLKKQHSHLLLTVFIVLLFIYCMFCFSFCFLHIGVNLPDSVKNILWLGIRPLSKCATFGHCRECEKITPHRKNIIPKTALKLLFSQREGERKTKNQKCKKPLAKKQ